MPRPRSKDPSCCSPACASYDQYRNFRSAARRSVRR
jgi:UDP-N-acetylmuramoylalanine-D-glutamate ligase